MRGMRAWDGRARDAALVATCADDDLFVSSILNDVEATHAPCPLALHRRVLLAARLCRFLVLVLPT